MQLRSTCFNGSFRFPAKKKAPRHTGKRNTQEPYATIANRLVFVTQAILRNVDIDKKVSENIDIDIAKNISENIDIDQGI